MHPTRHVFLSVVVLACLAVSQVALAQVPLQFVTVPPCRVVDTRLATGPFGGPSLQGHASRDFAIPNGACNIPSTAAAYSLNVTVVPRPTLGYLTVWPTGQPQPTISTLNSPDGRVKANAAIVPAGSPNQSISVFATDNTDVILDIDGYFVPANNTTLAFFPLTPCRVADTRGAPGTFGGPSLVSGRERIFPLLSPGCQIPDSAQGYSLNFTVVPRPTLGFLTVWPTGQSQPTVSTLNDTTGVVTANAAIVPGGTNQAISVYPNGNTDLIIDIDGYFAPSNSGQDPLSLYTLPPCRVLDTRHGGNGTFSGMLPVAVLASPCNVPSAQAYVLNATVIPYQNHPMGYLSLWPDAEGQPLVSTLNAADGALTSNMAIVPTLNGSIDSFAQNPTDMILDIFSYFAPITSLGITTTSLPSGTLQFSYRAPLSGFGGVPPYTWSITSGSLPPGLNPPVSPDWAITGTPTTVGTYPFTVQVADSQTPPATVSAPFSIIVNATVTQLTLLTTSLPNGTQNTGYSAMLAATGGVTPYTWSITSGNLPRGLSLNTITGAIIGTPSGGGTAVFDVQVTDSELPAQAVVGQLSITINPAVPFSITTTSLPAGLTGTAYSAPLTAIGGVSPYTWSLASGSLPPGLQLNQTTGTIFGTPTTAGTSNFTVQVADSETPPAVVVSVPLSITITPSGGGNPGLLSGHYAFYLNGFNSSGAWTLAGSFISDGNGNITSGFVDGNSVTGQPFNSTVSGTYFISTTGLNTLTIQGTSFGPATYAFGLDSTGNGRIIEYDDTTGQGSRGSGVLRKATASAFSLSALNGSWVYGGTGANYAGVRTVVVSQLTLTAGNITNGTVDTNEGGTYETAPFTGTMSAVDPQTGRMTATILVGTDTTPQVGYVVSTGEMIMEQSDSQHPQAGTVLRQSGTFNNGSLNGTAVIYLQNIDSQTGQDESEAGIAGFDGHGNYNIAALDDDLAGTITQGQPVQGTYTVQSNGAVALSQGSGNPIPGFLISQNRGMVVTDPNHPPGNNYFGIFEPQTGGPFSNTSIAGTYAGGSLAPLDYANARDEVDVGSADGAGNVTTNDDSSLYKGLGQNLGQLHSYTIAANGRGTSSDNPPAIFYVISPSKFIVVLPDTDAAVIVFEH